MTVIRMYEIRVSDLVIRSIATERPNAANARVLRHIGRRGISIWRFQHVTDVVHDADLKCLNIATNNKLISPVRYRTSTTVTRLGKSVLKFLLRDCDNLIL